MFLKSVYIDFFADSRVVIALVQIEMTYGRPRNQPPIFREFFSVSSINRCHEH